MLDDTNTPDEQIEPEQSGEFPKWKYPTRLNPEWGTVEKEGLVVGRGKNRKVIPPDDVYKLASLGCTVPEMADWFGVSVSTLKYNFGDYIKKGWEDIKQKLRHAQMETALKGNPAMLIWLGKNLLGQSDNPSSSQDNAPLPWTDDDVKVIDDDTVGTPQATD